LDVTIFMDVKASMLLKIYRYIEC